MSGVAIGPFVFAADRLAAILGIFTFMILTSILARRVDRTIGPWSSWALFGGLVAARLGHVALHWQNFSDEPWRILAIWQGGFEAIAGFVGVLVVSLFYVRSFKTGAAAAVAIGLGALVWTGASQLTKATLGQPAPAIAFEQMDGAPVTFGDLAGKPMVVNLWASWCPPCRREMPLLARTAAARSDVAFLFVNQGESSDTIRSYLARENLALSPVLLDPAARLSRHYNAPGMPTTLFLRADGTLASIHMGEISPELLSAKIDRITASR
jgi:thiol-disulfide isomerase/thioredoxin